MSETAVIPFDSSRLLTDLRVLIENSRSLIARQANQGLVLLNWHVGQRINAELLVEGRAEYGKQILATVSQELSSHYGEGYSKSALSRNLANLQQAIQMARARFALSSKEGDEV